MNQQNQPVFHQSTQSAYNGQMRSQIKNKNSKQAKKCSALPVDNSSYFGT